MTSTLLLGQAGATALDLRGALLAGFGLAMSSVLVAGGVFLFTTQLTTSGGWFVRHGFDGAVDMRRTSRWRLTMGALLLGLAAIVGMVGYLKISLETLVAAQVVYLASAGFGVIVLAVAGGALIVSDQLRADEGRIKELESALASLGEHLSPAVAEAPRLLDRS